MGRIRCCWKDNTDAARVSRRNLIGGGSFAVGATILAQATVPATAQQAPQQEMSEFGWGNALARIKQRRKVVFAMPGSMSPPQYYRDPSTREPAGYDVEIAKLIAKDMGVEPVFEEAVVAARILGVQSGRYDIALGGTANAPVRAGAIAFTRGYLPYELVLLVKADSDITSPDQLNAEGRVVTALIASTSEYAVRERFPKAQINPLKINEAMLEVASGRADACMVEFTIAAPFAQKQPSTRILSDAQGPIVLATEYGCLAVRTSEMALRYWLDNWLYWYDSRGTMKSIYDKVFGPIIRR